ncbi:MAG: alpha/beta fold hydrolase [Planctomycetia bacterium]|nr:alpha/beta fold hydrolase [Planctomycetia bacterium]
MAPAPGGSPPAAVPSPAVESPTAGEESEKPAEELKLETSDGLQIAAWYYAVKGDERPIATVILVHDLEGTHKSVEPLALALREQGFAVVAPDLRGHGASRPRSVGGDRGEGVDAKLLRKNDLEMIAASSGGRIRDQSGLRGDIEAVRNWIKGRSEAGELDVDKLCVVGSGAGAMLAAMWSAADWAWQPTTSGPQGQQVRGVVLVSPEWTTKGLSISTAMETDAIRNRLPILVLGGTGDDDAKRLFKQLKLKRPNDWFEQMPGKPHETAPRLKSIGEASLFHIQVDSTLSGDKLASDRSARVADRIKTFLSLVLDRKP